MIWSITQGEDTPCKFRVNNKGYGLVVLDEEMLIGPGVPSEAGAVWAREDDAPCFGRRVSHTWSEFDRAPVAYQQQASPFMASATLSSASLSRGAKGFVFDADYLRQLYPAFGNHCA